MHGVVPDQYHRIYTGTAFTIDSLVSGYLHEVGDSLHSKDRFGDLDTVAVPDSLLTEVLPNIPDHNDAVEDTDLDRFDDLDTGKEDLEDENPEEFLLGDKNDNHENAEHPMHGAVFSCFVLGSGVVVQLCN